jgi:hypothetical protein
MDARRIRLRGVDDDSAVADVFWAVDGAGEWCAPEPSCERLGRRDLLTNLASTRTADPSGLRFLMPQCFILTAPSCDGEELSGALHGFVNIRHQLFQTILFEAEQFRDGGIGTCRKNFASAWAGAGNVGGVVGQVDDR